MTMAYTDLNTFSQASGGTTLADGDALLNASLSSPLSGSGLYCRRYPHSATTADGTNAASEAKSFIKPTVKYGWFTNTPAEINLSLRAKVRIGVLSGSLSSATNAYIGVCAFAPEPSGSVYSGGYELVLQATSGTTRLALRAGGPVSITGVTNITQPAANHAVTCTGTYALDTWYHIRLDVLAISATERKLDAYLSTDNGANWMDVGTLTVTSADAAWRTGGRAGYASLLGRDGTLLTSHMIDDFAAYAE